MEETLVGLKNSNELPQALNTSTASPILQQGPASPLQPGCTPGLSSHPVLLLSARGTQAKEHRVAGSLETGHELCSCRQLCSLV